MTSFLHEVGGGVTPKPPKHSRAQDTPGRFWVLRKQTSQVSTLLAPDPPWTNGDSLPTLGGRKTGLTSVPSTPGHSNAHLACIKGTCAVWPEPPGNIWTPTTPAVQARDGQPTSAEAPEESSLEEDDGGAHLTPLRTF